MQKCIYNWINACLQSGFFLFSALKLQVAAIIAGKASPFGGQTLDTTIGNGYKLLYLLSVDKIQFITVTEML